jgi:hypothetical protein
MLIYSRVNCAFSPIYALSRTHLMNFKTASYALRAPLALLTMAISHDRTKLNAGGSLTPDTGHFAKQIGKSKPWYPCLIYSDYWKWLL